MGKTIFISSHILGEIATYCNKIGIMEKGKLIAHGSLEEILDMVRTTAKLKLTVLEQEEEAESHLQMIPKVTDLKRYNKTFYFTFCGNKQEIVNLTQQLFRANISVLYLEELAMNLEDAFMHLTKGELQ